MPRHCRDKRQLKFIEKFYEVSTNILFKKKLLEKTFFLKKKLVFENEIRFGNLIIYMKGWKLNLTITLIHPSCNGYLKM